MTDLTTTGYRQQDLYFNELFQLKVQCEYIRRYRDLLARRVTLYSVIRAVASSGSIAGWAIWKDYAFIWGAIIATSQLADAVKDVFPYISRHKAANGLLRELDALFIEALFEWENIFSGKHTAEEITERRRKLMQLRHDAENKNFPTGDLPTRDDLFKLAEADAISYLEKLFGEGSKP